MNKLLIVGILTLMTGLLEARSLELSLMQSAQTTKRPGAPATDPQAKPTPPLPGVIGVPTAAPATQRPSGQVPAPQPTPGAPAGQQGPAAGTSTADRPGQPASTRPPAAPRRGTSASGSKASDAVDFSFVQAPIESVVSAIMKELGYSYIIDPQVTGEVSVYTQGRLPRDQLFPILEQLLKMNGHGIVRQGEIYIIVPLGQTTQIPGTILVRPVIPAAEEATESTETGAALQPAPPQQPPAGENPPAGQNPPPQEETPASPPSQEGALQQRADILRLEGEQGVITYIIPLHFIPSSEMVTMAQAFVSEGATVVDFQSANTLLITDYRANIEQVLNLVHLLDTQYFDLNSVDLVPVRYNKAADVAEDLGKVYAPGDKAGGVRIVAIERLNSILLVTHSPGVLQEVKGWIDKLDVPSANSNVKTFVYQVENNTAANIAEILAQLYEDGAGLPSSPSQTEEDARPQQQPRRQQAGFLPEGQPQGTLGPSLSSRSAQSGVRAVVSGNVKIIVNEFNNSLIIQGTEADYQFLRATIEQLDVLPRQVLIEARIYTVELQNELSFGVSAFLRERGSVDSGDGTSVTDMLPPPTVGSINPGLSAATRIFVGAERQLDILIEALKRRTNVQMLEAPTLLVVDGTEAQINVGAEVPVSTGSFGNPVVSGQSAAFVNTISFRPTGTTLLLLPRISASGIVNLDLAIEVSAAVGDPLIPTINRNYVQTSLIARDNETVAIAGVISDSLNQSRSRVPLLGDIPILGALFGNTTKSKRRFELIFLITPRVVRNVATAVELTLDFRRALKNAYDFVNKFEQDQNELVEERRRLEREAQEPAPQPPPNQ